MLSAMLSKAVAADPAKIAVVQGGRRLRYDELAHLIRCCAGGLRRLGVQVGDCVAMALPNCPEFVVGLFACALQRAVMLPINPRSTREELQRILADARPKFVIANNCAAELPTAATVVPFETLLQHPPEPMSAEPFRGPVVYLHTSGSTDAWKRLCCTQENLYYEAHNFVETVGLTAADNILCTIPLYHSYGLGNCLLDAVYCGSTLVLLEPDDTPFVARCRRVTELIRKESIRFYPGVPHQYQVLAASADCSSTDMAGLKLCVSSGDVLPRQTYDRFLERFGLPIRSLYGSTEAGSIAINTDADRDLDFGSLGSPLRNVTIEIRDGAGKQLPANVDGEIWVKSPTIPPTGYDNRADLTHESFRAGFYKTGDLGRLDQRGHLILSGRKQGFITIAGNKVDTAEVEEVLQSCPGVREAAVLGVEVPRMGTLLKAALVTEGPHKTADIWEYCRRRLAFFKVPRLIEVYPALPRSALGKVLKSELSGVDSYLNGIRNQENSKMVSRLATAISGKRRSMVTSLVQAQVAAVLGQPTASVPRDAGFVELGMDSFGAIDLRARLEYLFDRELSQTFTFDHPTVDAITDSLLELVA